MHFYPRSPCGERRGTKTISAEIGDFYPRSPCGERPRGRHVIKTIAENFYPRSPCGERQMALRASSFSLIFLSTLSLRRATTSSTVIVILRKNFYPRSPCGERPHNTKNSYIGYCISIHALLAESDMSRKPTPTGNDKFLSTLSLRRATAAGRFLLS